MRRFPHQLTVLILILATTGLSPQAFAAPGHKGFDRADPQGRQLVLRLASRDVADVVAQYGLEVLADEDQGGSALVVVESSGAMTAEQTANLLRGDPRLEGLETEVHANLPEMAALAGASAAGTVADLAQTGVASPECLAEYVETPLWSGFADQGAARLIHAQEAQLASASCGTALVAVIDTGVDPSHPTLAQALEPGFDFLTGSLGEASEWKGLDQSVMPIVEEVMSQVLQRSLDAAVAGRGETLQLDANLAPILDPSDLASLEGQSLPAYFGHGTMVAGLVRLVAPGARILPLRVFDAQGQAHLFDVARAIYYAVDHGATVINMSFSMASSSRELQRALHYARNRGVVCVAAAGNGGEKMLVYPAASAGVVGVAATDQDDLLSEFSNHGSALVDLAAPGSGVISTYPGGLFATGWGTSFSAPLVSGVAALLQGAGPSTSQQQVVDLRKGALWLPELSGEIGKGRLDALGAVQASQ